jgi:hypothetical protein
MQPIAGCGGDHDRLAKDSSTSASGGAGGSGADGGATSSTGAGGQGGVGGIIEPATPTTLTVVNGLVDSDAIRVCFEASPAPDPGTLPWPGVQGLPFARGVAITELDGTIPADGDVQVTLLAGDLAATGGATCEALRQAPPANVQVATVGVLPAAVFAEEKSLLLVAAGCIGGAGHSHELEETVCGAGYSEATPNPTIFAGFMSRLGELDRIRMQFAQASVGLPDSSLRIRAGDSTAVGTTAVPTWSPGAIAPYPPFDNFTKAMLLDVPSAEVQLYPGNGGGDPFNVTSFAAAFANSTLEVADLSNGDAITFLSVGAPPGIAAGPWWNAFALTVVESLP